MRRRWLAGTVGLAFIAGAAVVHAEQPLTVVELFTSQGCSSCPPADEHLNELAQAADLLPLSFHVDYWNYIGWTDPFSSKVATLRQKAYSAHLHLRYIYTPQIVVDGMTETAGSVRSKVRSLIDTARQRAKLALEVERGAREGTRVTIPADTHTHRGPPAVVWGVLYDHAHTTSVTRGENAGRTITNTNVVRSIDKVGEWRGERMVIVVPRPAGPDGDRRAVIVQSDMGAGPILGAVSWPITAEAK
jgi:hypothetical protein